MSYYEINEKAKLAKGILVLLCQSLTKAAKLFDGTSALFTSLLKSTIDAENVAETMASLADEEQARIEERLKAPHGQRPTLKPLFEPAATTLADLEDEKADAAWRLQHGQDTSDPDGKAADKAHQTMPVTSQFEDD